MTTKRINLKYAKKIKEEFSAFESVFNSHIEKIKKEHQKILILKMNELISNIAKNENLNELDLREKYLNIKEKHKKEEKEKKEIQVEETLLDHVIIDGKTYFFENKDNGKIFNENTEVTGSYKNGEFIFN